MRYLAMAVMLLASAAVCEAGWFGDYVKESTKDLGRRVVDDASGGAFGAYQDAKEAVREEKERKKEESEEAEPAPSPPHGGSQGGGQPSQGH